jgi:hypothetical protein
MARIKIKGNAKKLKNPLIKEALEFFSKKLLKRIDRNVIIVVKLKKDLYKKTGNFGHATYTDDDARNHREFEIEVDAGLGPVFFMRTLAHEMVHIKQYARKELVDVRYGNYQKWNGFLINDHMVDYFDLPWEREAHIMEKQLYEEWKLHRDRNQ